MKLSTLTPCLLKLCCRTLGLPPDAASAAEASGTAPAAAPAASDAGTVIIIQATKRPEDIQQVPMSVTAYTSLDLQDSTDSQLSDLWQHTANTTQMDDHRNGMLSIRGVGYGGSTAYGGEEKPTRGWSPIGFYLDGVSLEAQRGMSDFGALYDVDTVELLRGPQGTLYGRNALGGVVNVRTKDPTWINEVDGSVYGGSYKEYRVEAAGGGPLSDTVAFRLAFDKDGGDGFYDNITTGNRKTDASNDFSGRGKLLWKATPELTLKLTVQGSTLQDSTDSWVPLALIDQHQTVSDYAGYDNGKGVVSALQADYQVAKDTIATVVFGFGQANDAVAYDGDRSANPGVTVNGSNNVQDISLEARLAHTGPDPLSWLVGFIAQQEELHSSSLSVYSDALVTPPATSPFYAESGAPFPTTLPYFMSQFAAQAYNEDARVRSLNAAIYGEGTYKIDRHWEVTGGARLGYERDAFTWDEQIYNQTNFAPPPATIPFIPAQTSHTDHAPVILPKGVLADTITPDLMVYASVARGYRPGGFDTGANSQLVADTLYEPEYTWNYELGFKSEVDRALTVDGSVFYIDWRNQQVPVTLGPPSFDEVIVNAAHSHVYGAELESELKPCQGLRLWGSLGLLKAEYTDYNYLGVDYDGKRFPNIPSFTAAVGAFYQHACGAFLGATLAGQGATYADALNTTPLSDYATLDAKLGFRAQHWSIAVLGRNLTNKAYAINSVQIPADGVFTQTPQTYVREGAPRTIGLELAANW